MELTHFLGNLAPHFFPFCTQSTITLTSTAAIPMIVRQGSGVIVSPSMMPCPLSSSGTLLMTTKHHPIWTKGDFSAKYQWLHTHHSPDALGQYIRLFILSMLRRENYFFFLARVTLQKSGRAHFSLSNIPIIWKVEERRSVSRWLAAYYVFSWHYPKG